MHPPDADTTPLVESQDTGPGRSQPEANTQRDLVDAMHAVGEVESLPMHLALARTRARMFDVHTAPTRLGRFELLEVIGRGATAVVHTARDPQLDRIVALKVFPAGLDSATYARVIREARLAASFSHPNVVTVLDVGETRGRIWVAMERFEGQTLREVLQETPRNWDALAPVFLPMAMGLQEVHRQGIVHRDVKPENVLLDASGRGVLTDFGVATWGPQESEAGAGGTPAYMSPEQLGTGVVGPASDQFSYCVMLFEAFEGTRPFPAANVAVRLEAIRAGTEPAFTNPSIPRSVRAVLKRGLAFDPDDRFPSMSSLAAALGHRRLRRGVPALGVGGALVAAGAMSVFAAEPVNCREEASSTRLAWTSVRDEVEDAFASGPEAFVIDGGPRVVTNLDRYVEDLVETRVVLCKAGQRGTLTEDSLAARTQCLAKRQQAVEHIIETLDKPQGRSDAIAGSYGLPRIGSCLNTASTPQVPDDLRMHIATLEAGLDALRDADATLSPAERLAQAETLVQRAHALGHRPVSIRALTALGNARMTVGDFDRAREAWEEAYFFALRESMPERSLELATAVVNALAALGRYDEAMTWARHARSATERTPEPIAASRVDYAEAIVLQMRGRPEQALALLTKTLQTRSAVLGPNHPTVADAHLEIGNTYLAMQDFDLALEALRTAREIQEVALGPRHPELTIVENNLGAVQFQLGRIDLAAQRWRQSLAIGADAFGEHHISQHGTLTNLAKASATQGDWDGAEQYIDRALQVWAAAGLGDAHPDLVGTLEVQGQIFLERGEPKRARRAFGQAVEICDAIYVSVEIPTLGPLAGAARAAWALNDANATAQAAQRFLSSENAKLFSPQTHAEIVWLQAQALWATGRHRDSLHSAERALDSYREMDAEVEVRRITQWLRTHES